MSPSSFERLQRAWERCDGGTRRRLLLAALWTLAITLALAHVVVFRNAMNADGVAYLDLGDAWMRADWNLALNPYWSPLYAWILGAALLLFRPQVHMEFLLVQCVNLVVLAGALACCHFLVRELIELKRRRETERCAQLPEWAWWATGYVLCIWTSLNLITIRAVTPDLLLTAWIYLAAGLVVRIERGGGGWGSSLALGSVLGLGYLTKALLLPLGAVFLVAAAMAARERRLRRTLIAIAGFAAIAAPYIAALSLANRRFTAGDSAKLNYAWYVSGITPYVHGRGNGAVHPTRQIFRTPAVYEFATPFAVTYPAWYAPGYWYEGVHVGFAARRQLHVLLEATDVLFLYFFYRQAALIAGVSVLLLMGVRGRPVGGLVLPALCGLALLSLVHLEARFIGCFVVILWLGLLGGVSLPRTVEFRRLASFTIAVVCTIMLITVIGDLASRMRNGVPASTEELRAAIALARLRIGPGDRIAYIGRTFDVFCARLGRLRIVAELPEEETAEYWAAGTETQNRIFEEFRRIGAKTVLTRGPAGSPLPSGWHRVDDTAYFLYDLR